MIVIINWNYYALTYGKLANQKTILINEMHVIEIYKLQEFMRYFLFILYYLWLNKIIILANMYGLWQ